MKRSKKIFILLGVLAVVCLAAFGVMQYEERQEEITNSDEIILELPTESVQFLAWDYEEQTLSFHREENWIYDEDASFPVDDEKINGLLEQFQSFGVSFIIENVEDYSQYGLEEPTCTIRLETEDQSYEILLGNYSSMDSERYVSIGDGNVYLVTEDPLEQFDTELKDLIRHDETPSFEKATSLTFAGAQDYTITYEEDSPDTYCADDVYFTKQDGENKPLDTSRVDDYLGEISSLALTDYVTYNATEEELASYGLDSPELTVTVNYSYETEEEAEASDTFVLHISRDPEEAAAAAETAAEDDKPSDEEEEVTAYARVGESQIVYQISADAYEALMAASYDDLRHQELLSADFADITQIDISLDGNVYTITSRTEEEEQLWYYQEEEIEITDLESAFASLQAESFTGQQPSGQEEISLTVYLNNENFPKVVIELYRQDGDTCLAMLDGEPVSFVKRSSAVDLIEAIHAIVLN